MNRWNEYRFKNGQIAKNRVVVPPMASQTADEQGFVTKKTIEHYKRLSESGAGIIFAEYSFVHQSGKGEPNQLGVNLNSQVPGLRKVSSAIKSSGALSGLQIVHVGGKGSSILTGQSLIGASKVAVPVKNSNLETPIMATEIHIKKMMDWYIASAKRAVASGFDIIELHAAHGYGLNQWLSPITNQRSDMYGGDIHGRSLLLRRLVQEIKKLFPKKLLAVRLPAQDHARGGLSIEDMAVVVNDLEKLGVDLNDVSSGIGGWRRPRGNNGQGYLVGDAESLKALTSAPIIGVGGITTGSYIDCIISKSKVDFTAVGRAILKDPVSWNAINLVKAI